MARRCCHNVLVYRLSRGPAGNGRRGLWRRLAAEVRASGSPALLISAELFTAGGVFTATSGRAGAARLAEFVSELDLDVRLLAYVRPQWQYAQSLYSQLVKRGFEAGRFEAWLGGALGGGVLDYGRALEPWRVTFGDRLSVHAVDLSGSGGELAAHFFGLLGVPGGDAGQWRGVHANRRPGAKELEVLRLACAALTEKGYGPRLKKRLLARLTGRLAPLLDGDASFAPLSGARGQALTERFARANSELAARYGMEAGDVLSRGPAPREAGPGSARWAGFGTTERCRVRRCVLAHTGADLEQGQDRAMAPSRWFSPAAAVGALRVAGTRARLYRARLRGGASWWADPGR